MARLATELAEYGFVVVPELLPREEAATLARAAGAGWIEAATLANLAGNAKVRKLGVVPVTRQEIEAVGAMSNGSAGAKQHA
jgi:bifunctional ADP-heptose synthase (sugar kinase/adenylyltransferase)